MSSVSCNVAIFGGGIAGLWLLHSLRGAGYSALLFERHAIGAGQTVWSQGILHGGAKYTLRGLSDSLAHVTRVIADMPAIWRECLEGKRQPDLSGVAIRQQHCHLWRTSGLGSWAGIQAAGQVLKTPLRRLDASEIPAALAGVPGEVYSLGEQVVSPLSLMRELAARNSEALLQVADGALHDIARGETGVCFTLAQGGQNLSVACDLVVLAAGAGNDGLRQAFGLSAGAMQIRPLTMVMVRKRGLGELNGHCVDGARTRVTITTDRDAAGRTVWQVGGQLAEEAPTMGEAEIASRALVELMATVPSFDPEGAEVASYRADRAEEKTSRGFRPDDISLLEDGRIVTVWPTKLVLAPRAAELVLKRMEAGIARRPLHAEGELSAWPRPRLCQPPWELPAAWRPMR